MDLTTITQAVGLASSAVGLTGKAAETISSIKGLFESGKAPSDTEAAKLLNTLASELAAANMMNVQLSQALKTLSVELLRQDDFENEKAKYELFQTSQRDMVYRLKNDMTNAQPEHFICPVCLNRNKLVSFISGEGDYKTCQTDNSHVFRFKDTPWRQPGRAQTDFDLF